MSIDAPSDWYRTAFDDDYVTAYSHRNEDEAFRDVDWTIKRLAIANDSRILDVSCGSGRHVRAFRRRGLQAFGLDLSATLLRIAVTSSADCVWVRGDQRRLPFREAFDVVTFYFTSFGYFADDTDHASAITEAARVSKRGARLLIDLPNKEFLVEHIVPSSTKILPDGRILEETRWLTADGRRVNKTRKLLGEGGVVIRHESVRLFEGAEIDELLHSNGYDVHSHDGALSEDQHGAQRRMVVTAVRNTERRQ